MQIEIYNFTHAPEIYADMAGQFFRSSDERPLKKVYQNGRIAIQDNRKFYGIKRLRLNAIKAKKEINDCPF